MCTHNKKKLSVIVPCFNEANSIELVIKDIASELLVYKFHSEIIIVDDGSTDLTYTISKNLCEKFSNLRIIKHNVNKGFGAAFWSGVNNAEGEYLLMMPGDGECNVKDSIMGIKIADDVDVVIPFVYNKINRSLSRRIISRIYTNLINVFFHTRLNYTNGTVIYRTSLIKNIDLKSKGFFFQTEILLRLIKSGYLYAEFPVFLKRRSSGLSKALSPRSFIDVVLSFSRTYIGIFITKRYISPIKEDSITFKKITEFNKSASN